MRVEGRSVEYHAVTGAARLAYLSQPFAMSA